MDTRRAQEGVEIRKDKAQIWVLKDELVRNKYHHGFHLVEQL